MAKLLARSDVVSLCSTLPFIIGHQGACRPEVSQSCLHPIPMLLFSILSLSCPSVLAVIFCSLALPPLLLLFVPIPQSSSVKDQVSIGGFISGSFREPCPWTSLPSFFLPKGLVFIDCLSPKPQCTRGEQKGCYWWWFRASLTADGCWRQRNISFRVATARCPGFWNTY